MFCFVFFFFAIYYLAIFFFHRISYSVYELKKLKENISSGSLKIVLMYDIACLLSTHLKVSILIILHVNKSVSVHGYLFISCIHF